MCVHGNATLERNAAMVRIVMKVVIGDLVTYCVSHGPSAASGQYQKQGAGAVRGHARSSGAGGAAGRAELEPGGELGDGLRRASADAPDGPPEGRSACCEQPGEADG